MEKKRVGILGGGQLGRMLAEAASPLDIPLHVLDPNQEAPAFAVVPNSIVGNFRDASDIGKLADKVDILTCEIEHVNVDAIEDALKAKNGKLVAEPAPSTIRTIQDKYKQKVFLTNCKIPVADFQQVKSTDDIIQAGESFGYPLMLKSKTLAYDGRGNAVVKSRDDITASVEKLGGTDALEKEKLYVEKWAPFVKELAVMVAKSTTGEICAYPVVETIQKDNICHVVISPAQIELKSAAIAKKMSLEAIKHLDGAGIYGVELFLLENGEILLNEIAPRPHNSGHYTIEACYTSQFEQHLRAIMGMPLGCPNLKVGGAVMLNVLGAGDGEEGMKSTLDICSNALAVPGASIHWYGKKDCKNGRKMGHITFVADSVSEALNRMYKVHHSHSHLHHKPIPLVGVIMGSDSDLPIMKPCAEILRDFNVPFELTIVSAHRTPDRLVEYARTAHKRGLKVIISAAGGAAHLPGMTAAMTPLPVIGVPVALKHLDGVDSLHSIVQMPRGVPVATVAINNSTNAALLAIRILGAHDHSLLDKMREYQRSMEDNVLEKVEKLNKVGWESY